MLLNLVSVVAQILLIVKVVNAEVNKSEVVLVNVLFRHGERTPESFYPTDPHKENNFYPNGMGSLTNEGKRTVYKLGVFLRDGYDTLLGNFYASSKIYARSTESPRAQMSALLVLAGLWPPKPDQQWHPTLLWQPIPIHSMDYNDEDLLDSRACKYTFLFKDFYLKNHTMNEKFLKPYTEMLQYIENNSGMEVRDLISLQRFYFILATEHELGLPLPHWTEKVYPEPIYSAVSAIYKYFNSDLRLRQINVGYLLQKMIKDFAAKIKGMDEQKVMYLYSAHDTTLGYFLDAISIVTPHVPKYGSAILLELHRFNGNYFVKLRYLRSPQEAYAEDLHFPNCDVLCPFEKFIHLYAYLMPNITHKEACARTTI